MKAKKTTLAKKTKVGRLKAEVPGTKSKPRTKSARTNWDKVRAQYAARLDGMQPFQCKVLSWPHAPEWFEPKNRRLAEAFARISGCVSISANWFRPSRWASARQIAAAVPGTVLAVHFSPYHTGGWEDGLNPCKDSWRHNATLSSFHERLSHIKRSTDQRNVPIGFIVYDHEKMRLDWDAETRHDSCIAEKLIAFDRIARDLCPAAEIIWYGAPSSHGQGRVGPRVNFYAPSLYRLWWTENIYAEYYRSRGMAVWKWPAEPVPRTVPFVALGAGYREWPGSRAARHDGDEPGPTLIDAAMTSPGRCMVNRAWKWDMSYEYPLAQSELCGSFLRNAPGPAHLCFYPEVPEPETGRVRTEKRAARHWWDHLWVFKQGWDQASNGK